MALDNALTLVHIDIAYLEQEIAALKDCVDVEAKTRTNMLRAHLAEAKRCKTYLEGMILAGAGERPVNESVESAILTSRKYF